MRSRLATVLMTLGWVAMAGRPWTNAQGLPTLESLLREEAVDTAPLPNSAATRLTVPSDDEAGTALELIRQAYEEDYAEAAKSPQMLIDKLLTTAGQVEDATRKYVLLVEAERVAISAGNIQQAIEASTQRSGLFDIDPAECRLKVLLAVAKSDRRDDAVLCRGLLDLVDQSLALDRIDVAEKAVAEALAAAKRTERRERQAATEERKRTGRPAAPSSDETNLVDLVGEKQKELKDHRKWLVEYEEASRILQRQPDDPAANARVGRYRCFVKGEWDDGLAALQAGDSEKLRSVAAEEVRLRAEENPTGQQVLAVAGAWWKAAEAGGVPAREMLAMKRHAVELYEKVLPAIEDPIERALASKRIGAASPGSGDSNRADAEQSPLQKVAGRRGATLKIPSSAILPAPATLSRELVSLLPTEAEVKMFMDHVNLPDGDIYRAKGVFMERIYGGFNPGQWTVIDALYLIELNDRLNVLLGKASVRLPKGSMSGSREGCKTALAAAWLLTSKSEKEFVARRRSLPADALRTRDLDWNIGEREVKEWLMGLGPDYTSTRRKLQAIEYLSQQGAATEGMRKYAEALLKASAGGEP